MWGLFLFLFATKVHCQSSPHLQALFQTGFSDVRATYYDYTGSGGHCSILENPQPPAMQGLVRIAMAGNLWDTANVCGMCIEFTGDDTSIGGDYSGGPGHVDGTFQAFVVDECPECVNSIDLGDDLGTGKDGIWEIDWHAIPCPVGDSKFSYQYQGSNPWYTKIQVRNHRIPVTHLSIRIGGVMRAAEKKADNFFELGDTADEPFPREIQITCADGEVLTDFIDSDITSTNIFEGTNGVQCSGTFGVESPTNAPQTDAPPTNEPTDAPPTNAPPTNAPPSGDDCLLAGVNLAGAEFGDVFPGTEGTNYFFPTEEEIDYFVTEKGMQVIRIPFKWERLQRNLGGDFNSAYQNWLTSYVQYTTDAGAIALIDPHNYARYSGSIIGDNNNNGAVTFEDFADFWTKLANLFKDNALVWFGIMNEPNSMSTELWLDGAQAAIDAIRATNAQNFILVPGNAWTGAHSWQTSNSYGTSNAEVMSQITDSANNFAFELHQYLDGDYSGRSADCQSTQIGVTTVTPVTEWMRENGYRAFLGEFAGGQGQTCLDAVDNLLSYMGQNTDVWIGWTWWAAGPQWGDYIFTIEPTFQNGQATSERPQMPTLETHIFDCEAPENTGEPEGTDPPVETDVPTDEPETDAPTDEPEVTVAPTDEPEVTVAPTDEPEVTVAPTDEPEVTVAPTDDPEETQAPGECIANYEKCGGLDGNNDPWMGSTTCCGAFCCNYQGPYYSQCRPDNEVCNPDPNATDAPVTDAPGTDAPVTDAPVTDAPVTDAPETNAPETDAPVTDAPETDPPQTDAPQTDAPQTDAPLTEAPETEAPETAQPTNDPDECGCVGDCLEDAECSYSFRMALLETCPSVQECVDEYDENNVLTDEDVLILETLLDCFVACEGLGQDETCVCDALDCDLHDSCLIFVEERLSTLCGDAAGCYQWAVDNEIEASQSLVQQFGFLFECVEGCSDDDDSGECNGEFGKKWTGPNAGLSKIVDSADACCEACKSIDSCVGWTFDTNGGHCDGVSDTNQVQTQAVDTWISGELGTEVDSANTCSVMVAVLLGVIFSLFV